MVAIGALLAILVERDMAFEDDLRRRRQRVAAFLTPALMMLRPAAMLEPAHQRRVRARHLHAVDTEIEVVLATVPRTFCDDQRPGDERRGLARPAGLDRKHGEVDLRAPQDDLLAWRRCDGARPHRNH